MAKNLISDSPGEENNLIGTPGADKILGLDLDDVIYGKGGNDLIIAGPDGGSSGYDQVWGGRGADKFVFYEGDGDLQIEDFRVSQHDKLDLSHTGFEKSDLKDTETNDRDGDGYYLRETSANGVKELQFYFHNGTGTFDLVQLEDISLKQLKHDVKDHPGHYDFA